MNKEEYEKDLKRRQEEHLRNVSNFQNAAWRPCMHDQCSSCLGTGVKSDGSVCVHFISCPCSKCSPQCLASNALHKVEVTNMYDTIKSKVEIPFRHAKILDWDNVNSIFQKYLQG